MAFIYKLSVAELIENETGSQRTKKFVPTVR